MRLEDYLYRHAGNRPDALAVKDVRRAVTFAELLDESMALAATLQSRQLESGDRVAVIMPNRVEFIVSAFACFLGGFVFQPVNFRFAGEELSGVLDDSGSAAILVDESAFPHHARIAHGRAEAKAVATVDGAGKGFAWATAEDVSCEASDYVRPANPGETAALLYTGGTTGSPKGVVLSHRSWVHSSRDGAWALRVTPDDISYQCVPLFHVSFVHFLSLFYVGAPTLLADTVRPEGYVDAIVNRGATHTVMLQAAMVDLVAHLEAHQISVPRMKALQYGGSPIPPVLIARVNERFGDVLHQSYGLTEGGGSVTYLAPEDHSPDLLDEAVWQQRIRAAGRIMPGMEAAVFADDGTRCGRGVSGEVRVRSEAVMTGYWNNPEATQAALSDDGWLSTGDIGYFDEHDYLFIIDRKKDMIISGGENIYAVDVERTLSTHPAVSQVAVVGAPHKRFGEQVVAFVALRTDAQLNMSEFRDWFNSRLAGYKRPSAVYVVEAMPTTVVGKIHKPSLRERLGEMAAHQPQGG